jgi:hypothetical protein
MTAYRFKTLESGVEKWRLSGSETLDFLGVRIGADNLSITEGSATAFDFGAKKLGNIVAGSASGHAVEYDQFNTALGLYIPLTQKGANSGVATLDAGGKIPLSQLPASLMEYQGTWDASSNSPALADGTGVAGFFYRVQVAGTQNLGSGSQTFVVGDWIMYNGSVWQLAHSGADNVVSVNGYAGVVVLTKTDIGLGNVDNVQQLPMSYLSTDGTMSANSDVLVPSQKAIVTYVANATTAASSALDGTFVIKHTGALTKQMNFSAANITAGQTRTLTMPDANVDLGNLSNSNIAVGAGITYGKLSLAGSILNSDLAGSITASNLVGTDISTVGTITIGTWHGTAISNVYGGTGVDSSAFTGVAHIVAGVWTASAVTNADLAGSITASKLVGTDIATVGTITVGTWHGTAISNVYGGTGVDSSAFTGVAKLVAGVWSASAIVNADIASGAAIAYAKLNLATSISRGDLAANVVGSDIVSGLYQETNGQLDLQNALSLTNDNAGAVTVGQFVYVKANGHIDLADASTDTVAASSALGIVRDASIATTAAGFVNVRPGTVQGGFSGFTPGLPVYLSISTPGAVTQTIPSGTGVVYRKVGFALSATQLYFAPEVPVVFAS